MKKIILVLVILLLASSVTATEYINDDSTGGDCSSIGNWDPSTKTCTLTSNVSSSPSGISIKGDLITLDCAGYTIIGDNIPGDWNSGRFGIIIEAELNVTVKNCNIKGFSNGIKFYEVYGSSVTPKNTIIDCNGGKIEGVTTSYNTYGIGLLAGIDSVIRNCEIDGFKIGIFGNGANNNNIQNNIITNGERGLFLQRTTTHGGGGNWIYENTICGHSLADLPVTSNLNSGDENTCDTNSGMGYVWNDIGTTGCTYSCPIQDEDGDGVPDTEDVCPGFDDNMDNDGDGVPDGCDNCPNDANSGQEDIDNDGLGDACDPSECTFRSAIQARGQGEEHGLEGAISVSNIYIGIDENAVKYTAASPPPNCTAYLALSDNLNEDIRKIGPSEEEWTFTVAIGDYADPNLDGYYPVLSWDTNEFCLQGADRKFQLYAVDEDDTLTLLIGDMLQTNQYQTKKEEGMCIPSFGCWLKYSIIWSSGPSVELDLQKGWSLISLPVIIENASVSDLFPETQVIYGFEKESGYVRIKADEVLNVREGYWILMPEAKSYPFTGAPVNEYNISVTNGWFLIGSCSSPAQPSINKGNIDVIYGFNSEVGYERVSESERLYPAKGYWILLSNTDETSVLTVKTTGL